MSAQKSRHSATATCPVCKQNRAASAFVANTLIRRPLAEYIASRVPEWDPNGETCLLCLNRFRGEYITKILEEETGELSNLNRDVASSLVEHDIMTRNVDMLFEKQLTLGNKVADKVASFGGSWKFIGLFGIVLLGWMIINVSVLGNPFDPYPFILLNLVLSSLAAIQAPVLMMSQNRQEEKDRMRGEHDYRINLKAELEIRHLHEKIDLLLNHQWSKLMEIQTIQTDMMEELIERGKSTKG